jgi:hypothetical protein
MNGSSLRVAALRPLLLLAIALVPAPVWAGFLARRTVRQKSRTTQRAADPVRILALSHQGFRGDLEALADSGEAEVWLFPPEWQTRFVFACYGLGYCNRDVMNPEPGSRFARSKARLAAFYDRVLDAYLRLRPCDIVVSFHMRAPADIDLARAAMRKGVRYCTIFREGLVASSDHIKRHMRLFFGRLGRFQGDHFLVHSASARDFCIAEGFVRADQVQALGCIRMDGFLDRIAAGAFASTEASGTVTLFPPTHYVVSVEEQQAYLRELYVSLIGFFAENLAYNLVIKPKPKQLDFERDLVETALSGSGIDLAALPNVTFNAELDAHEALRMSDVVVGLNSTALLEAGIAGKPVIAPLFTVLNQESAREAIRFADAYAYFDVARDGASLARLLAARMAAPSVDEVAMQGRRAMFEKYVTTLEGNAVRRYVDFFRDLTRDSAAPARDAA